MLVQYIVIETISFSSSDCTDIRVNINGIYDLIKIEVYSIIVNLHEGETWGSQEESLFLR
jgi:hypothetical protein